MNRPVIIRKPLASANCNKPKCEGVMMRLSLSRLEEVLGHEGHECDRCGKKVKYVPKQ